MAHKGMDYVHPIVVINYQMSSFPMTTQTRIFLAKRYIADLLQEIPDQINAYEWKDLRLVVYSGRERKEIVFSIEELADDSPEGKERIKEKVEVGMSGKGNTMK